MQHSLWLLGLVTAVAYGLVIGSFLNVVIWRVPQGISIASPVWSFCPKCEHRLGSLDLVPLLSFLALGRRCGYCKEPISWRYFTVEAITGLTFLAVYLCYGYTWASVFGCLFSALLITIFFIDLDTFTIPDELNVLGIALGVAYNVLAIAGVVPARSGSAQFAVVFGLPVPNAVFAAVICALIFHAISLAGYIYYTSKIGLPDSAGRVGRFLLGIVDDYAYLWLKFTGAVLVIPAAKAFVAEREEVASELENDEEQTGMGQGDAKLAAMIGAFLYLPQSLVAFLAAFLIGGLSGIGLMVFQKKGGRTAIPFGPYLVIGAMVSLLFGTKLVSWYLAYAFGQR